MHALHVFIYARNPNVHISPPSANTSAHSITLPTASTTYLDVPLLRKIDVSYEKARSSETYKVHRVILNKLDDITTATTSAISSGGVGANVSAFNMDCTDTTADLPAFVKKISNTHSKDMASSLKSVWTGRVEQLAKKRRQILYADDEEGRDQSKCREETRSDGRSTDDEGDISGRLQWSKSVHRKIESWAG